MAKKLNTGEKELERRGALPSPMDYRIQSTLAEKPGKTIGAKLRVSNSTVVFNPGPGQYEGEKTKTSNFQYSMAKRLGAQLSTTVVPGPGAYRAEDSLSLLQKATASKIGHGLRSSMDNDRVLGFPGPGDHDPNSSFTAGAAPKYGFGTES